MPRVWVDCRAKLHALRSRRLRDIYSGAYLQWGYLREVQQANSPGQMFGQIGVNLFVAVFKMLIQKWPSRRGAAGLSPPLNAASPRMLATGVSQARLKHAPLCSHTASTRLHALWVRCTYDVRAFVSAEWRWLAHVACMARVTRGALPRAHTRTRSADAQDSAASRADEWKMRSHVPEAEACCV